MPLDRRQLLHSLGLAAPAVFALPAGRRSALAAGADPTAIDATSFGIVPDQTGAQTPELQAAIDAAAERKRPLRLPGGTVSTGTLTLRRIVRWGTARVLTVFALTDPSFIMAPIASSQCRR